ncbi:acetylxylan esterase [Microbacterium ulmi]|uniref:Prolyl oligopeptidase family serine peptidase n=1 Tax=Microbacterium ulmi TaxID=179095 RepID=A0A7Y2Q0P7_9MICO|nr:acetylxylan esterase [Microbacterium ulmi]NII70002.1 cephalosporin-C deacetylase [Microbacterium ulmi]NNH04568.1 prolyl oligopeptidase family serine peptidase [Microbacterium ulmi]
MARFDLPPDQLREYRPAVPEPTDFDAFWATTIAESRGLGGAPVRVPLDGPLALVDVFDATFPGFAGDPVRAWLVLPRHRHAPLPAVVEFVGYGRGRGLAHERLHWPVAGFAQLIVDTRGQGSTWGTGGSTPDPHGAGPATPGFLTRGIEDPAGYYYRRVFTDAVRAVDAVRSFPEIDPTRVAVTGNSQGGLIAIAAAGLSDGLAGALPTAPILCDVRRVIGLTNDDPHGEITRYLAVHRGSDARVFETLSYFDGVNFAKRATAPSLFGTGHMDTIAPPSGVYAALNHWGAEHDIVDYPWNHHEGGETLHWLRQAEWLGARVAASGVVS